MLIQGRCGPPRWYFWDSPDVKTNYKFLPLQISKWKEKNLLVNLNIYFHQYHLAAIIASTTSNYYRHHLLFLILFLLLFLLLLFLLLIFFLFPPPPSSTYPSFVTAPAYYSLVPMIFTFFPVGESRFLWLTNSLIEKIAYRSKYEIFCTVFNFQL